MNFIRKLFTFRNAGHKAWFIVSMIGLVTVVIISDPNLCKPIMGAHAFTCVSAYFRNKDSLDATYSPDCIWFNALMAIIHTCLFFYLTP